jgi:hypothetical protein
VRGVRALLAGAEWDMYEVRYVWEHDGVFVKVEPSELPCRF